MSKKPHGRTVRRSFCALLFLCAAVMLFCSIFLTPRVDLGLLLLAVLAACGGAVLLLSLLP